MKNMNAVIKLISVLAILGLIGCSSSQQKTTKSSVVDYLYPKSNTKVEASVPVLKLPIKLGIAFVPEQSTIDNSFNFWASSSPNDISLTEVKKIAILKNIAAHFKKYPFIAEIQQIPSSYLTPGGSFANLDQIKTMYGIDVIALVSHDQVQFTDESFLSLSYWTLVGAYVVSGEKNDTSTLMDTTVYDIASRKLLFRAPGTSNVKGRSTPVNLSEELRADSIKGFDLATQQMISNLDAELARFREKVKENPEQIKVVQSTGYSGGGGGALDLWTLVAMVFAGVVVHRLSKS
jgi:rhombotail lipoprotein